ncbi:MAG: hypothetical protein JNK52_13505, partial [Zoogloeaceae bacterium]|nr:hypothetical protein [Zoogloeaceae bacterium]
MIHLDIAGTSALSQQLAEVPKRLERAVLLRMSQIVYDHAERAADRHTKTG